MIQDPEYSSSGGYGDASRGLANGEQDNSDNSGSVGNRPENSAEDDSRYNSDRMPFMVTNRDIDRSSQDLFSEEVCDDYLKRFKFAGSAVDFLRNLPAGDSVQIENPNINRLGGRNRPYGLRLVFRFNECNATWLGSDASQHYFLTAAHCHYVMQDVSYKKELI